MILISLTARTYTSVIISDSATFPSVLHEHHRINLFALHLLSPTGGQTETEVQLWYNPDPSCAAPRNLLLGTAPMYFGPHPLTCIAPVWALVDIK